MNDQRCATMGCDRPATGTARVKTAAMPAPGFYLVCDECRPAGLFSENPADHCFAVKEAPRG